MLGANDVVLSLALAFTVTVIVFVPNAFSAAWAAYTASLKSRPRLTSAISGGCLAALGNRIGRGEFSVFTLHFAIWGVLVSQISGWWLRTLGSMFAGRQSRALLFEKVFVDQCVTTPLFSALFPIVHGLLQGVEPADIWAGLVGNYGQAVLKGWQFWPAVSLIGQAFVPPQLLVVFFSFASLVWNTLLTIMHSS
jgi:protein Mpv17